MLAFFRNDRNMFTSWKGLQPGVRLHLSPSQSEYNNEHWVVIVAVVYICQLSCSP